MIPADDYHATAICLVSIYVHSHNIPADHRTGGRCEGKRTFERHRHQTTHANSSPKIVVISIIGNNNGTTTSRKNKRPKKSKKNPRKIAFFISVYVFSAQSQLPGVSSDSACCVLSCTQKNKAQKNKLIFKRHIATLGTPRRKEP